jgi:23S rRNA (cytidine1920-2'-O)/16S rRNA (cytidine1409-2'-O)-methyltransferase
MLSRVSEKKIPLIDLLCMSFPDTSRKDLFARVLCGEVYVNNEKICNAKRLVGMSSHIEFRYKDYVSRGGIKLAHVLNKWNIEVKNNVFIDAGCSMGGFTDCLLKHGAGIVYAVDVGYNQLAYSLRNDHRVRVYERTNIMDIQKHSLDPAPDAAVCDLSFRSIRRAASHILYLVSRNLLIALVKPQFEWENPQPGFSGVIENKDTLLLICKNLVRDLYSEGVSVSDVEFSPIRGTKGNRELFFLLKKGCGKQEQDIPALIEASLFGSDK